MTSLLEGAERLVTRGTDIGARIEGLDAAATLPAVASTTRSSTRPPQVVDRATGRLRLSATHTVVGIAGATGSGKSSTFNALTGLELSAVGVRRPTTSWATACVWGRDGADELLEWLGIPPRHQTTRDSMLDSGRRDEQSELDGVVLLDLPDHDSTEVAHHLEVDRLVDLADLLVWVLDPQKYADAAIHDRYLAPSVEHQDVLIVVLNHIDTVPEERRQSMLDDVRRLLDADGLDRVPVLPVSAREGIGIAELRAEIARRAAEKQSTRLRIDADVRAVAARLDRGHRRRAHPGARRRAGRRARRRVRRGRRRPDRRGGRRALHPDAGRPGDRLAGLRLGLAASRPTRSRRSSSTSAPTAASSPAAAARCRRPPRCSARRWTARSARSPTTCLQGSAGRGWRRYAGPPRSGSTSSATGSTRRSRPPRSAPLGRRGGRTSSGSLQWLLLVASIAGLAWTGVLLASGKLDSPDTQQVGGVALALVLLVGGVVLGIVIGLVCRLAVAGVARRRAAAADQRLREAVREVSHELVVDPIEVELAAYTAMRAGLSQVLGSYA